MHFASLRLVAPTGDYYPFVLLIESDDFRRAADLLFHWQMGFQSHGKFRIATEEISVSRPRGREVLRIGHDFPAELTSFMEKHK